MIGSRNTHMKRLGKADSVFSQNVKIVTIVMIREYMILRKMCIRII